MAGHVDLARANREESPNEKPDQHPWSKVWDTDPQQEREDKSQDQHVGKRIQERPEETKNRIPVPDFEVLLSKHHHNIKVVADAASRRHLAPLARTCGCRNSLRGNNDCCIRHMPCILMCPGQRTLEMTRERVACSIEPRRNAAMPWKGSRNQVKCTDT